MCNKSARKRTSKMNNITTTYEERENESTFELNTEIYESSGSEFQVLSRKLKNALCMKNKRKKDNRHMRNEVKERKYIETTEQDGSILVRPVYDPAVHEFHCKNCAHQVLSENLIMCAMQPVTHITKYTKGYLTPKGTPKTSEMHWLVKFPCYGEILWDAGYQIILDNPDSNFDQLKWKNTRQNRNKVRRAFAKLQKKFKGAPWVNHCNKRCQNMSCSINEYIQKQKRMSRAMYMWETAFHASACDENSCQHHEAFKRAFNTKKIREAMNVNLHELILSMPPGYREKSKR